MSGKGSGRRPEAEPNAYANGYDLIFGKKDESTNLGEQPEPKEQDDGE